MRRAILDRPFTDGVISDLAPYQLRPQASADAENLIAPDGTARQRKGWSYANAVSAGTNLRGVWRNRFVLADVVRTIGCGGSTLFDLTSASTVINNSYAGSGYLPRCVYRDELILCSQNGQGTPLLRWGGSYFSGSGIPAGTPGFTVNSATVAGSWSPGTVTDYSGLYLRVLKNVATSQRVAVDYRVLSGSTTAVVLDGIRATLADVMQSGYGELLNFGHAYPACTVYDAGTASVAAQTATGIGTRWNTAGVKSDMAMLLLPAGDVARHGSIRANASGETSLTVSLGNFATPSNYQITASLPWTDATSHRGSLCGTGVREYPNRVYISPPDWNPSLPPGFTEPFDASQEFTSSNPLDFLLDYVDVPAAYDGDKNIAILSGGGPLLVLKRSAVYGIYGTFPNFQVELISAGTGCIDMRSAVSTSLGQVWAGQNGIYAYQNGQVVDLTRNRINRAWRALTYQHIIGTDYCAIGERNGHLIVTISTTATFNVTTWVMDMTTGAWMSKFTNHGGRFYHSSRIAEEGEELYWVADAQAGRVMKSDGCLTDTGKAFDADGTKPYMVAHTPENVGAIAGIEGESKMLDLAVHANVRDIGTAGATVLSIELANGGGEAPQTKALGTIPSDQTEDPERKYVRHVNRSARLHQIRLRTTALGTDSFLTEVEVPQIVATFWDARSRV